MFNLSLFNPLCYCIQSLVILSLSLAAVRAQVLADEVVDSEIEFSRDIRPVLSDQCFLCHGPDEETREAGLRLDQRDAAIQHGVFDPENWSDSELLARIQTEDPDLKMPPPESGKQLSADETKLMLQWVSQGAEYTNHWAFETPRRPEVPPAGELWNKKDERWVQNPIDAFVLRRMQREGLQPSTKAEDVTLIRRMYLDLIGLPPSPAEVDAALELISAGDFSEFLEHLLDSPHFGEKWARWWLDAARYADSDGYEKDKPRSVWFYRDWVIQAMQRDMPYDQFVIQQIAGDLLPEAGQSERVATGFLRNSMVNEEGGADPEQFRVEGMFDRLDAIGKAILGITTQCAQCHTHKYDPLSQAEYYQMFAALNDFHEAMIPAYTPEQDQRRKKIVSRIAAIEAGLKSQMPDWEQRMLGWADETASQTVQWKTMVPTDRPFEGQKFRPLDDGSILSESYAPTKTSNSFSLEIEPQTITAFRLDLLTHPQLPRSGPGRSIYGTGALTEFEVEIAALDEPDSKRKVEFTRAIADVAASEAPLLPIYRDRDPEADDRITGPIGFAFDGDHKTAWTTDSGPDDRNQDRHAVFFPKQAVSVSEPSRLTFTLRQLHGGWNSDDNQNYLLGRYRFSVSHEEQDLQRSAVPVRVQHVLRKSTDQWTDGERQQLFSYWRTTVDEFADANAEIERLLADFPEAESQLVVQQRVKPRGTYVMLRGDFLRPGAQVRPGVPAFLNDWEQSDEPPRLQFAKWLVSRQSPTAARVIVNRIWQAYFGRGLVETPEDFGYQSAPPSHPELLDWLAVELMESHWSLQHIHRLIVSSATYQQDSKMNGWLLSQDPANQWLARGPRFRVSAELVRDIALQASGLLNPTVGGPSVYPPAPGFLFQPPASYGPKQWPTSEVDQAYRRSLYIHQYRSVPYPPLQVFDAPKGDAACVRRSRSNTPLQALVLLNESQFVECARAMAARVIREAGVDDHSRLQYAHRLCVSRNASGEELDVLRKLLEQQRERIEAIDLEALIGTSPETYQQLTGRRATDFAPWIVVCRALLNLDETITKE